MSTSGPRCKAFRRPGRCLHNWQTAHLPLPIAVQPNRVSSLSTLAPEGLRSCRYHQREVLLPTRRFPLLGAIRWARDRSRRLSGVGPGATAPLSPRAGSRRSRSGCAIAPFGAWGDNMKPSSSGLSKYLSTKAREKFLISSGRCTP